MSNFFFNQDVTNLFDQDFGSTNELSIPKPHEIPILKFNSFEYYQEIFNMQDPLKHVSKYQFKSFTLDTGNIHFVKPHYVDSYVRSDGTVVEGYFRDGDGNTSINRTVEQGGGYFRSNPDGNPWNNLK